MKEIANEGLAKKVFSVTIVGCLIFILASVFFVLSH